MDEIKYFLALLAIIFIGYVAVRLWSYGIFRSYFDAKKPQKGKENKNAKTE